MQRKRQITVIGDSAEIEVNNKLAGEVGIMAARNGWALIQGGRGGVMSAASKACMEQGGLVVSILPDDTPDAGHPYKTIAVASGLGYTRNVMNILSCDAVIGIGGGSGTLSELAFAWAYNKTIFALSESAGWSSKLAGQALDTRRNDTIIPAADVAELESLLKKLFFI